LRLFVCVLHRSQTISTNGGCRSAREILRFAQDDVKKNREVLRCAQEDFKKNKDGIAPFAMTSKNKDDIAQLAMLQLGVTLHNKENQAQVNPLRFFYWR
jgi:hypothetical protein